MRIYGDGRGLHSLAENTDTEAAADSCAFWTFDESDETYSLKGMLGESLVTSALNKVELITDSPINGGREIADWDYFEGSATGTYGSTLAGSDWTVDCVTRIHTVIAADGYIIRYEGAGATKNDNVLLSLKYIQATNKIQVELEHDVCQSETHTFSYVFTPGIWYYICVTKSGLNMSLYVNGGLQETHAMTNESNTDVAPAQIWTVGASQAGANKIKADFAHISVHPLARSVDVIERNMRRILGLEDATTVVKIKIETEDGDAPANTIDLTDLAGVDWIEKATYDNSSEDRYAKASVTLRRNATQLNLSKFHDGKMNRLPLEDSANPGIDDTSYSSTAELLDIGRPLNIYTARVPAGTTPVSTDWQLLFEGEIDSIDWGSGYEIILKATDAGATLERSYTEETIEPGVSAAGGCAAEYDTLEHMITDPAPGNANGILDLAFTNGWIPSLPSLVVPTSSSWCVKLYSQERVPVLNAINNLASQIGWVCRYKWNHVDEQFDLTLYEPDRSATVPSLALNEKHIYSYNKLAINRNNIRNVVQVVFPSTSAVSVVGADDGGGGGLDSDDNPVPGWIVYSNAASITKYGRQFCEICEGATGNIDTVTEAETLAEAILNDLKEPTAEASITCICIPELEIEDVIKLKAIEPYPYFTSDQTMAISSIRHTFTSDGNYTELELRGSPTAGAKIHLRKETRTSGATAPIIDKDDLDVRKPSKHTLGSKHSLIANDKTLHKHAATVVMNPDFESRSYGPDHPPDRWEMLNGTWGTKAVLETTTVLNGKCSIKLTDDNPNAGIVTDYIPIAPSTSYIVAANVKGTTGDTSTIDIACYNSAKTYISNDTDSEALETGQWILQKNALDSPANSRFAKIRLYKTGGTSDVYYDSVQIDQALPYTKTKISGNQGSIGTRTKIEFDTISSFSKIYNENYFDTANYYFVAPQTGLYYFHVEMIIYESADAHIPCRAVISYGTGTTADLIWGTQVNNVDGNHYAYCTATGTRWVSRGATTAAWAVTSDAGAGSTLVSSIAGPPLIESTFTSYMIRLS